MTFFFCIPIKCHHFIIYYIWYTLLLQSEYIATISILFNFIFLFRFFFCICQAFDRTSNFMWLHFLCFFQFCNLLTVFFILNQILYEKSLENWFFFFFFVLWTIIQICLSITERFAVCWKETFKPNCTIRESFSYYLNEENPGFSELYEKSLQ